MTDTDAGPAAKRDLQCRHEHQVRPFDVPGDSNCQLLMLALNDDSDMQHHTISFSFYIILFCKNAL